MAHTPASVYLEALKLNLDGMDVNEAALAMGVKKENFRHWLYMNGYKYNNKPHRTPIFYQKAYALYQTGLSLREVAEKTNKHYVTIVNAFKKYGYKIRKGEEEKQVKIQRRIKGECLTDSVKAGRAIVVDGIIFYKSKIGRYSSWTTTLHRYIWEKENGPIPKGHHIHHINGNHSDNRIENLECISGSEHMKLHWRQDPKRCSKVVLRRRKPMEATA